MSRDYLSRQAVITCRLTEIRDGSTIVRMGRRTAASRFKAEFCSRLKAARIVKQLTQAEVAKELGIPANTYTTYEKRTILPHELVGPACEILGITSDYLYGIEPKKAGKAA